MLTNFTSKNINNFYCEKCDFKCFKKGDWKRHLNTRKHTNVDKMLTSEDFLHQTVNETFECECGKKYTHRQSLSVHKKKCNTATTIKET